MFGQRWLSPLEKLARMPMLISNSSEVIASQNKLKCEDCLFQSPQCQLMLPVRECLWISTWTLDHEKLELLDYGTFKPLIMWQIQHESGDFVLLPVLNWFCQLFLICLTLECINSTIIVYQSVFICLHTSAIFNPQSWTFESCSCSWWSRVLVIYKTS